MAVAVAVVVAAAVDVADAESDELPDIPSGTFIMNTPRGLRRLLPVALLLGGAALVIDRVSVPECAAAPAADAKRFATPEAAADALVAAAKEKDPAKIVAIFGESARDLIVTDDPGAMAEAREAFLARAAAGVRFSNTGPDAVEVTLGADAWPFPIPLVKIEGGWAFDTEAGREEVLRRRIGANELSIMEFLREFGRAQADYARVDRDGDEVREYATRIASTPGTRDGLWWAAADATDVSPLGEFVAAAGDYAKGKRPAGMWHGYYLRILTKQGANPPGGKYDYVINGNMIAGFALVAFPADYRKTGVMTFMVSHQGKILEKDLGADTETIAGAMVEYDPDTTWQPSEAPAAK